MEDTTLGAAASRSVKPQYLVCQPQRRRYRARAKAEAARPAQEGLKLLPIEQDPNYQRLLARLVRRSSRFQLSLTHDQRRDWLKLEDAFLDHAWLLHGYYFKAGYELGKRRAGRRASGAAPDQSREQAVLLSALVRLLDQLMDE